MRPFARVLLAALCVTACSTRPGAGPVTPAGNGLASLPPAGPLIAPNWTMTNRARITDGHSAVVVSGSPIASAVGREILQRGGNAVDAAVAVGFALEVVHPEAGNIGGGGFMIIRPTSGPVRALDYREEAPGAATPDMYLDQRGNPTSLSITGALAAGVPGSAAGLVEAQSRYGHLPLAQVIAPAIRLATEGFVVDSFRSRSIDNNRDRLFLFTASRRKYLPDSGHAPAAGTLFKQPDLARTLTAIRDNGWDGFYRGWVADSIVAEMQRDGGIISHADLEHYHAIWRDPITIQYRGYTIYSMPPSSSGGVTMGEIFNILEGYDSLPRFGSPGMIHLDAEAMRRAFTDRNEYLGDPAFVKNPLGRLLSKAYADSLRRQIQDTATPTPAFTASLHDGSSTTHYSVVDAEGNAVSVTTTLNNSYGSAVTVSGAGFLLNDEMDDFASAPGKPNMYGLVQGEANAIRPHKRMLSAMTPSVVNDPQGHLFMVVGTPGGPRIITMVYHVISNVIDHGMPLPLAVSAPRDHDQALPDRIEVESHGFYPAVLDSLRRLGYTVAEQGHWGDVEAIIRTSGGWEGVSDPRYGGGGAGY